MPARRTDTERTTEERRSVAATDYDQQWIASRRQLRTTAMTTPDARGTAYRRLLPSQRQVFLILTLLSTSCPVGKTSFHLGQSLLPHMAYNKEWLCSPVEGGVFLAQLRELFTENAIHTSSAMAERPRELGDFKGVSYFEAKFRLKDYVSHQRLWTVRWRNGYTITLPLEVFTQRNFVPDFIRLKLNFIE